MGMLIGSLVIGVAVGLAMYFLYGTAQFRSMAGANRVQSAVVVGVVVAVVGFVLRLLGWL
jgi:hypothetical protein